MTEDHALYSEIAALDEAQVYLVTAHAPFDPEEVSVNRAIGELLSAVRELLQLDVVFVGEIVGVGASSGSSTRCSPTARSMSAAPIRCTRPSASEFLTAGCLH